MSFQLAQNGPGRIMVSGALTFETAAKARDAGIQAIESVESSEIQVDCGGVTQSDSAGLAVLLDWLAHARNRKLPLRFVGLPDRLFAISQISEIEDLLAPQRSLGR